MNKELKNIIDNNQAAFGGVMAGDDLFDHTKLYGELYAYFLSVGDMPYGIAKARTGDPVDWITDELNAICA